MKRCSKCGETKSFSDFHSHKGNASGLSSQCKECRKASSKKYNSDNKEKLYFKNLLYRFGVNQTQYQEMLDAQSGVCAICGETCKAGKNLAVDHDHACCPGKQTCGDCIRGLLCANCNVGIGYFNDSVDLLKKAIYYLEGN
jgi:hypothetical protein